MRMFRLGVYLAGIACLFLTSLRADDTASPKAEIEKAIDAVGGLEKLNKYKAFTAKGTGKLSINGAEISFTFDAANQLPDKARVAIEGDFNGTKFTRIQIRNGDKGWVNTSGSVEEMTADQIAIAKEETYAGNVISLAVLNGPGYTLTAIPDAKVEGKPAVG